MENTIQLYSDREKKNKVYPITSPDRVIDENGISIKSQLDNKVNLTELSKVDLSVSNKADKSYVDNLIIDMSKLGQDVKTAISGGSVAVVGIGAVDNINLKDNSLSSEKMQIGSVTLNKRTVDILPKDENMWSTVPYTFTIGRTSNKGSYGSTDSQQSLSYRHDTLLIEVEPNSYITVTNNANTNYKISIQEFDISKLGVADRGYQVNSVNKIQLSANTRYIRLICSTKDGSKVTISDMKNIGISVEASFSNVYNQNNYSDVFKKNEMLYNKTNSENIISLRDDIWEKKDITATGLVVGGSTVDDIYNAGADVINRFRLKKEYIIETYGHKRLYLKANSGYSIDIIFIDSNNKYNGILYLNGLTGAIDTSFVVPDDTQKLTFRFYKINTDILNSEDLEKIEMHLSYKPISYYKKSYDDLNYSIKSSNNKIVNILKGNSIKYIGHAGTAGYAPENTLEAMRVAKVMGMWGAECDLCITSDKKLVLMHDYTVDRTTNGTGRVDTMTLEQIKSLNVDLGVKAFTNVKVPTIEEYLDECKKLDLVPIIEVKNTGVEDGVIDILVNTLNKYNIWDRVVIISFGKEELQAIRSINKIVTLAYLTQANQTITDDDIFFVKELGNACINCHGTNLITKEIIEKCHKQGVLVMTWTINDSTMEDYMRNIGIDAITTDTQFEPTRNTKTYKFQLYTTDKGVTWNVKIGKTLITPTITRTDDWVLDIDCGEHIKTLLQQLEGVIIVENNTYYNNGTVRPYAFKQSNGLIKIQLLKDNMLIKTNALTDNNLTLNCKVEV